MTPAEPLRELGKMLLIAGVVLAGAGALFLFAGRLPFRLGRLPGDISYQGRHGSFYFPDGHLHCAERGSHAADVDCEFLSPLIFVKQ